MAQAQSVRLSSGEVSNRWYWCVESDDGGIGVITLKHVSGGADFDLYLYSDSARRNEIGSATLGGTNSEIIIFNANSDRCVYIRVRNYEGRTSTYNLYVHQVSYAGNIAAALATAGLQCMFGGCGDQNDSSTEDAMDVVMDSIVTCMGQSSRTNTISCYNRETRTRMGRGFWSIFAVDLGSFLVGEIYRYY